MVGSPHTITTEGLLEKVAFNQKPERSVRIRNARSEQGLCRKNSLCECSEVEVNMAHWLKSSSLPPARGE